MSYVIYLIYYRLGYSQQWFALLNLYVRHFMSSIPVVFINSQTVELKLQKKTFSDSTSQSVS
jgi:hypothetical protein